MSNQLLELFGENTSRLADDWQSIAGASYCPFVGRQCVKSRKSQPEILLGTCSVKYGKANLPLIICPHRLLERRQIFLDCIHLLVSHEPGNELHVVSEVPVPGGSIDYALISVQNGKVRDFAGIELQALDTSGSVWPERQQFLIKRGVVAKGDLGAGKSFGINWKMTAKTALVQMHHKIDTFENLGKHLVLVIQDALLEYMRKEFSFGHVSKFAKLGDSMHFHAYTLTGSMIDKTAIKLEERCSTDSVGISKCLGLKAGPNVKLEAINKLLEAKISESTLLKI